MRSAIAVVVAFAIAGCAVPVDHHGLPAEHPDGWDQSPEFVPFDGFRAHSGGQSLKARAPDEWTGDFPAACQAYQEGHHTKGDSCTIVPKPPDYWFDTNRVRPTWYVEADWDGNGQDLIEEERHEEHRTVVLFAADGAVVGHVPRAVAFAIE